MKYLIVLLIITNELFAVVSIKPVEIGDETGFSGGIEMGLDTKRGNTDKDLYKASTKVLYDSNVSYVTWLEVSGEYGKANGLEDTNKLYAHYRYIHKLSEKIIRYELFAQAQKDKFRALKHRNLGGAGLRFTIFDTLMGGKGFFGFGGFYEDIKYTNPTLDPDEQNTRLNSYLAYSIKFSKKSSLAYTLYVQPLFKDFNDYVLTNSFELSLKIIQELYLKFSISYDYDSRPPNNVLENYDLSQSTTFIYNF